MGKTIDCDDQLKFKHSMLAMVLFGIGEILGCFVIGFVVDRFGSRTASVVNIVIMITMTLVTLVYCVAWEFSWIAHLMCFLWGL